MDRIVPPRSAREIGAILLPIARSAVATPLGYEHAADERMSWLRAPGASFVTLKHRGALRGCVGSLRARRPLVDDVRANAFAAAFRDRRFPPLTAAEYADITIAVSLLSPLRTIECRDEASALVQITPHVHGVVLEHGGQLGTFLPDIWMQFPDPSTFLARLKAKMNLAADFWSPGVTLSTYEVETVSDEQPTI